MIIVAEESALSEDAGMLLAALSQTLKAITGSSGQGKFDAAAMAQPGCCFAIARDGAGNLLGCGAIRPLPGYAGVAELKRMFALKSSAGAGTALLRFLESRAREARYHAVWLETRRINQRAVDFYLHRGYQPISAFAPYCGKQEAVCLGRNLNDGG